MLVVLVNPHMFGGNSLTGRKSQVCNERDCCDERGEDVDDAFCLKGVLVAICQSVDHGEIRGSRYQRSSSSE